MFRHTILLLLVAVALTTVIMPQINATNRITTKSTREDVRGIMSDLTKKWSSYISLSLANKKKDTLIKTKEKSTEPADKKAAQPAKLQNIITG
jgi:hypothetical protein